MNTTQGNGTDSSIPFISSEIDTSQALLTAVNSINIILGLPINSYVLWLILSGAGGTIASEFFYLNLTATVIISSLASVFYFALLLTHNYIFYCIHGLASAFVFFYSVPWFQCCICVERYIAVVHPVVFLRYKALRYRVACCCVVWLMSLAVSSLPFWSTALTALSCVSLCFSIVCISVMSFCCFSVLRALKQPGPGEGQRGRGEGNDMKGRAFKIILISLIVLVLTVLCQITVAVTHMYKTKSIQVAVTITYSIVVMSGLAHPLLYIYKARKLPCFKGF